jgi:Ulp1 family protease
VSSWATELKSRGIKICAKEPGRRRSHFFNSFFVQKLFDEKNRNRKLRGRYNYENVKGWSVKVPGKDIFT